MNALKMDWPDNSFDLVWACESGEHMPDKKLYVEEMTRVLKPGAVAVLLSWHPCTCVRCKQYTKWPHCERGSKHLPAGNDRWHHHHRDLVPA